MFINALLIYLLVLVMLGYFTLLERKVLGYGQIRKGPNKGVIAGLFQPLLDGFKLFMKGLVTHKGGSSVSSYGFGVLGLVCVCLMWWLLAGVLLVWGSTSVLVLLVLVSSVMGLVYYCIGFETGGVYSKYGGMRTLVQIVTYEGGLFFILITLFLLGESASMGGDRGWSLMCFMSLVLLVVSVIMESSRTPVDFVEGESELVSGLVTELGGLSFSLMFLLEYGSMGFYSCFVYLMFWGAFIGPAGLGVGSLILMVLLNWLRLSLPRSRYDLMLEWGWKYFLIVVFCLVLVGLGWIVV